VKNMLKMIEIKGYLPPFSLPGQSFGGIEGDLNSSKDY